MDSSLDRSNVLDEPVKLGPEEREDPFSVVFDFFSEYRLSFIRQLLDEVDEVCLTSDEYPFDDLRGRERLMVFHRRLELLLEAAHIMAGRRRGKKGRKLAGADGERPCKSSRYL